MRGQKRLIQARLRALSRARFVLVSLVVLELVLVLRVAWVSDDAFITARAVRNLLGGHGLVSNAGERVQGFTNTLWALFLIPTSAALSSAYDAMLLLGVGFTLATTAWLVLRCARDPLSAALGVLLLFASSTLVDFSTSGLENPLSHFLIALSVTSFLESRGRASPGFVVSFALLCVNRLDLGLLLFPALVTSLFLALRRDGARRTLVLTALGLSPLIAWEAWSLFYYGSLVPNTALAKLNSTLPVRDLLRHGASYLADAAQRDPLLPCVIGVGLVMACSRIDRSRLALGAGLVAYLGYVVSIGGDFMSGRILTPAYVLSVSLIISRFGLGARRDNKLVLAGIALGNLLLFPGGLSASEKYSCVISSTGVANERLCYAEHTRLSENVGSRKYQTHDYFQKGRDLRAAGKPVEVSSLIGMTGYAAGANVHIIDPYALTDPLLARLPFTANPGDGWRPGHFGRPIPAGYVESVERDTNAIVDPCLHELYDRVRLVTRGPLFSWDRLRVTLRLQLGAYSSLAQPGCSAGR